MQVIVKSNRCFISNSAMRSLVIVIINVLTYDYSCFIDCSEQIKVEALVSNFIHKGFNIAILIRLSFLNELMLYPLFEEEPVKSPG